jgi:hypothetical protein
MNPWTYPSGGDQQPWSSHQSFINILDCTISRESWNPTSIEVDPRDKSYNHKCHDPRLFFAGAPSAYMEHPLASTLHVINGFCQDSWHIGVDRDWRECKDRQLWVEIDRIQVESIKIVCHVKMKGKAGIPYI